MRGLRRVESPTGRSCWGACLRCLRCLVQEVSSRGQWWCVVWCCRKEMGPWTLYHIINYNHISWIISVSMKHTSTHLRSPYWDGFSFQVSQPGKAKRQSTHLHPVPGPPPFLPPFPPWWRSFTSTLHLHSSIQPGQETWREITNLQAKSDWGDPISSHTQIAPLQIPFKQKLELVFPVEPKSFKPKHTLKSNIIDPTLAVSKHIETYIIYPCIPT